MNKRDTIISEIPTIEFQNHFLEDILANDLRVIFCGTAAGRRSAQLGQYYAGPGNKFWRLLAEVGLTPRRLEPSEFRNLLKYGIGLTDIVKGQAGSDGEIDFARHDAAALREKLLRFEPGILCFNGKRAAKTFLRSRIIAYGLQDQAIGRTRIFVAPSTSGAANRWWDRSHWEELARLAAAL